MELTDFRRALAIGALLALPAAAQDGPVVITPSRAGAIVVPNGPPIAPPPVEAAPCPPGRFGWRARHAEHKRHLQNTFLGYPEEFNEWPLGGALYAHGRTMAANGAAARMILNHYDFVGDTDELNYRGRDKLEAIRAQLPASFAPVIVERTPWAPGLDQTRRLAILSKLAGGSFPVPAERVVIGPAISVGTYGVNPFVDNAVAGAAAGYDASGLSGGLGAVGAAPTSR